jgi:hypothetical protein
MFLQVIHLSLVLELQSFIVIRRSPQYNTWRPTYYNVLKCRLFSDLLVWLKISVVPSKIVEYKHPMTYSFDLTFSIFSFDKNILSRDNQ